MRWPSFGSSLAAVAGSSAARRACSAGAPSSRSMARASARACGPGSGMSARPRVSEAKYRPVPPVRIGSRPLVMRPLHREEGLAAPPGDAAWLRSGADAVESDAGPGFLVRRRARGEHAQFAINLHGVSVDDGASEAFRQRQGERGLAAGGRTRDQQGVWEAHAGAPWRTGRCHNSDAAMQSDRMDCCRRSDPAMRSNRADTAGAFRCMGFCRAADRVAASRWDATRLVIAIPARRGSRSGRQLLLVHGVFPHHGAKSRPGGVRRGSALV